MRPSQARRTGELTDSGLAVTEVRRIDIDQLAPQLPGEVAPVYLDLISSDPAVQPGDPAPVPAPELSEGPHLSYAGQWLIFAIAVAIGWIFAVRRSIRTHRRRLADGRAHGRSRRASAVGFARANFRRSRHDDALNSSVIARAVSAGERIDPQVRRPAIDRQIEEHPEELGDAVAVEPHQRLQTEVVEHARPALSGRPHRLPDRATDRSAPPRVDAAAMASTTRGTARSDAPSEYPVAGWM